MAAPWTAERVARVTKITAPELKSLVQRYLESLDLMVSIDIYRNESANHADYILPGLHFLVRADVPFFCMTAMGLMPQRFFTIPMPS